MKKREFYDTPKSSWIMRLFWKAAGADRFLLESSTYGDQIKYVCLGGIIVATGVMAGIAGGFAFYTIFEPKGNALDFKTAIDIAGTYNKVDIATAIKSILFGIVWGLIIFNIDRFIITSTGKGDGTEAITKNEIKSALPRIIMGMIIALTISKPLEIRMFKTEIDVKLHEKQLDLQKDYEIRTRKNFEDRLKDLSKENGTIQSRIDDYLKKITIKDSLYNIETSSGQGKRIKGEGPVAIALKNERDRLKSELDQFTSANKEKIDDINAHEKEIYKELNLALSQNKQVSSGLDGLLERIKLAEEIAGWVISLFITLLFMAIELTPIFFKLMLIKSPYDYLEENLKELIKADAGIEIKHDYYQDKEGHERELVINHDVIRLMKERIKQLEMQSDLSDAAMNSWKEQKIKDIKENPSNYVNNDTNG